MNLEQIIAHFPGAKKNGVGYVCKCPVHDDSTPSLSIQQGSEAIIFHCHAGCLPENILAKTGLKFSDLYPEKQKRNSHAAGTPQLVATYDYTNERGEMTFQVCRFVPKTFRQRHPDRAKPGVWVWNMEGIKRVLYRLPDVLKAKASGKPVIIAEGEKDCDVLKQHGFTATCNSGGAGKWLDAYTETLRGCDSVVISRTKTKPDVTTRNLWQANFMAWQNRFACSNCRTPTASW